LDSKAPFKGTNHIPISAIDYHDTIILETTSQE